MRKTICWAVAALVLVSASPLLAADEAVAKAQAGGLAWLGLVDAGKYGETWDEAAAMFKASIGKPDWEKALKGVYAQLGALKSRTLASAKFTTSMPGAPDGEYVVIQFDSKFEHKASAVETVTAMHEKDGSWRVAGYFIR